ncbi:hypothetical protein TRFO_11380 [Tritrichomonas foetus]|uniref:Calponin-homology (CH) domain-containing protein n=1 Tax=Tritrichomonas foetus TaxID=1144522 RepID=A0A1J4JA25_9EUKA|nr:hypothetical protein TRFO_11380 [Tritrichomonas foetus]|eukprot:OHS94108.1 hypothetical protein TRFO_11380 [Tritrichomonas foetus]
MSARAFTVSPETLIFRNSDAKEKDTLEVSVHNITKNPIRIRFYLEQSTIFSLTSGQTFMVPPCLSASVKISHRSCSNIIEKSYLKITSPDEKVEIPIIAYPPSPNVQFNSKSYNLGTISNGSSKVQKFTFTNFGTAEGFYKIKCDQDFAEISPNQGRITVNSTIEASLIFSPPAPGSYSFHVSLQVDKNVDSIPPILFSAEVVDQSIVLQYQKEDLDCLDFGQIFYGQKRYLSIQIVNNSSSKRSFTVSKPASAKFDKDSGTSAASLSVRSFFRASSITYDQRQNPEQNKIMSTNFSISPTTGELKPNSSTSLMVTFSTPAKPNLEDVETIYSSFAEVYINDTDLVLPFKMTGSGVKIGYSISCVDFDFQKQKVKSKTMKMLSITNESKFLPIQFSIRQIAHYHFNPSSGTIPPNGVKDVQVIFSPNSLGLFNVSTNIVFCQNLLVKSISLSGESVSCIEPVDLYKEKVAEIPLSNGPVKPEFALTKDEVLQKREKRKIFDNYLTDMINKREEIETDKAIKQKAKAKAINILKQTNLKYTDEDLHEMILQQIKLIVEKENDPRTLGIEPHEGLIPPNPHVRIHEPMKLPSEIYFVRNTVKKEVFNDRVTIKKKFKPKPTKKLEVKECAKKLPTTQLLLLIPSSQLINFGTVSVFSKEIRSFQLTNNLQMHVLAEIITPKEINDSTPKSQVIPPNQTAGFDIILDTNKPGSIMTNLQYKINGFHTYSVTVIAHIIPIEVILSNTVLLFTLPEDSFQNFSSKILKLRNKSNSIAKFEMSGFDSTFFVLNKSGQIQPDSEYSIEITYKPDTNQHHEKFINISILGGASQTLKLIGDTGNPVVTLNKKIIDFGLITLGVKNTDTIELKNDSDDDAIFSITPSFTDVLSITPPKGRVKKHSSTILNIEVTCEKHGKFDLPITVTICGAMPLQFRVTGHAEIPQVSLKYSEPLDFGKLYLGSTSKKKLIIENVGIIPATLYLNLSDYKMFTIHYSTRSITAVTNIDVRSSTSKSIVLDESTLEIMSNDNTFSGIKYRIYLFPKESVEFELIFSAMTPGKVSFNLPLELMNVSDMTCNLQPLIIAEALQAPLFLSALEISFGSVPLHDPLNPNNRPKTQSLVLRNGAPNRVSFHFNINSNIFILHQTSGTIERACSSTIFVHFKPLEPIPYALSLPLYVTTDAGDTLVAEIQLTGIGTPRKFITSSNYVALPIVPLGMKTQAEIDILNIGCIPSELAWSMSIDEKQFPINITFPKGNKMNFNTLSIPIKISFVSSKPLSFSTVIAIHDKHGNSTAFTVSVTTDNSIFTLYTFLSGDNYKIEAGCGNPIMLSMINESMKIDLLSYFLTISDFYNIEPIPSLITDQFVQFLVLYLNDCVLTNPIRKFPYDFIDNGINIIFEIVTNLTGKKPGNELVSLSRLGSSSVKERYKNAQILIRFLMSQGALLSTVKPEFLLSQSDFSEIMQEKVTLHLLGIDYYGAPEITTFKQDDINAFTSTQTFNAKLIERLRVIDSFYRSVSFESWTIVILQIIKLYMFGKLLDNDSFMQIPGVKNSLEIVSDLIPSDDVFNEINRPPLSMQNSNVFSAAECLILKWASIHYSKMNGCLVPVITDFTYFKDPKVFLSIFASHLLDHEINKNGDFTEILNQFKYIKVNFIDKSIQLDKGNSIMYALTTQQLMKFLPHYLPSSVIEFKAPMNQISQHIVSITNPSNAYIGYTAILKGSDNFSLKEMSFELAPMKTHDFIIEYFPKMHYSEKATLTLIPSHPMLPQKSLNSINNDSANSFQPKPPASNKGRRNSARNTRYNGKNNENDGSQRNSGKKNSKTAKGNPRNKNQNISSSISQPIEFVKTANGASTIVIEMHSQITYSAPYKTSRVEGPVYGKTKLDVMVSNITKQKGKFQIFYRVYELTETEQDDINLPLQMKEFMDNPDETIIIDGNSDFDNIVANYCPFIFDHRSIDFKSAEEDDSDVCLGVEFVPILMKSYRCLLLFKNDDIGEIIYEIDGKATFPDPISDKFSCKCESMKSCILNIPLDFRNSMLFNAIAYTQTKLETFGIFVSDAKFSDIVAQHAREVQSAYIQFFKPFDFTVAVSSNYFTTVDTFQLDKNIDLSNPEQETVVEHVPVKNARGNKLNRTNKVDSNLRNKNGLIKFDLSNIPKRNIISLEEPKQKTKNNELPLTFLPKNAGEFPCKVILQSFYDNRVISIIGNSMPETKYITIEFETIAGNETKQLIPIENTSDINWLYKVTYTGYSGFSGPLNFLIKPHSTYNYCLTFFSAEVGSFDGTLVINNRTKEFNSIYTLKALSQDPPAYDKLIYTIKAREKFTTKIPLPPFSANGEVKVTSTLPVMDIPQSIKIQYLEGKPLTVTELQFDLFAVRSGYSVGTLTLTDALTGAYIWYVLEVSVDPPDPEETVHVSTITRKPIDINIPVKNSRDYPVTFEVDFDDKELIGSKIVTIDAKSKFIYVLHFNPMIASERITSISFYNDIEGEYIYDINIQVTPPELNTMAPLTATIGSTASTIILLENPLETTVVFKIDNDNPKNFQVMSGLVFSIPPNSKLPIEVRFIPTSIGTKASANVIFKSRMIGDWSYRFNGYGKPPLPFSPVVIESVPQVGSSEQIPFKNPFPFMARFEAIIQSDSDVFSILSRRRLFTLSEYGEEHQIAFSFLPRKQDEQYNATLLVATVGIEPAIHWTYPIIGNTVYGNENRHISIIRGKANIEMFHKVTVFLTGDKNRNPDHNNERSVNDLPTEPFYNVSLELRKEYEWLHKSFIILPIEHLDDGKARITFKIYPRKPVQTSVVLLIENNYEQKWRYNIGVNIEQGNISRIISLESSINIATSRMIKIVEPIRVQTEFSAYFLPNSSQDLSVSPSHAIIEPSLEDEIEFPFKVTYQPKMYGKMMKGILAIESIDTQYLFEIHGRMPNYHPPNVRKSGKIDTSTPDGAKPIQKTTRNFIKENIESIKALQGGVQAKLKAKTKSKVTRLMPSNF